MSDEKNVIVQETNGNGEHYNLAPADGGEGESYLTLDRKLVRKIDWHLLPWICILYALGLLDRYSLSCEFFSDFRINISVARISGMDKELVLTGNNHYNVALLVFFPGYFKFWDHADSTVISCWIFLPISLFASLEPQISSPSSSFVGALSASVWVSSIPGKCSLSAVHYWGASRFLLSRSFCIEF